MTRVVFLTPNWDLDKTFLPTDTLRPPPSFPIEWGYLAAWMPDSGCCLLDEYAEAHLFSETAAVLRKATPKVVVISTTPSYLFWRCPPLNLGLPAKYVQLVRRTVPDASVVLIGPHGTIDPTWTLARTDADYAFRGEPDQVLGALLSDKSGELLNSSPYLATPHKVAAVTPQVPSVELGFVDYRLMSPGCYAPHAWGREVAQYLWRYTGPNAALLETSRGCSFNCNYCLRTGFRKRFRTKPLDLLAEEVKQLASLGVRYVFIIDETFGHSWAHSHSVISLLKRMDIKYGIQTRPDRLNDEIISELAVTGCVYVELGLEALEIELLERLGKFRDLWDTKRKVDALKRVIPFVNTNILDLTNEDYLVENGPPTVEQIDTFGNAPPAFIPYPTTPFGDEAIGYYRRGTESPWEVAEDLFILYSLMSRHQFIRQIVRRRRSVRRILRLVIHYLKRANIVFGKLHWSRFENLYAGRRGARKPPSI